MTVEQCLADLRNSLLSMNPAQLFEAERLVFELREELAKASQSEAAQLLPVVRQTQLLSESAEMLLGSLPGILESEAAGYTALGTPAGASSGTVLRA